MNQSGSEHEYEVFSSYQHLELQTSIKYKMYEQNLYDDNDLQSFFIMMAVNSVEEGGVESKIQNVVKEDREKQPTAGSAPSNCNVDDVSHVLNITPIQNHIMRRQKYLIIKYIQRWKSFAKRRKENSFKQKRQETVNNFINKLQNKKCKSDFISSRKSNIMVQDFRTYQHRYKVQKNIIALQKAKLEEQNKVIEELKLNKIVEASSQSLDGIREDIRKTYYEMDRKIKPKLQCLSKEFKITEFEEPTMVLQCLKMPQFLRRMEARAREREERHALTRERRRQQEEERARCKQQEEIERAEMDREEKSRRMRALREIRKREKIENIRKKQYVERMRALVVMADLHYERSLMAKYGILALKRLVEIKRDNMKIAAAQYTFQLKKNVFLHWMWHTEDMWFERNYQAEDFHRKKCLRKAFQCFKKIHREAALLRQVAEDYSDLHVARLVLRGLRRAAAAAAAEHRLQWQRAETYHSGQLLFRTFTCWRTLPALNALKREQEIRKAKWRQKVLLVVPDYHPPED